MFQMQNSHRSGGKEEEAECRFLPLTRQRQISRPLLPPSSPLSVSLPPRRVYAGIKNANWHLSPNPNSLSPFCRAFHLPQSETRPPPPPPSPPPPRPGSKDRTGRWGGGSGGERGGKAHLPFREPPPLALFLLWQGDRRRRRRRGTSPPASVEGTGRKTPAHCNERERFLCFYFLGGVYDFRNKQ